MFFLSQKRSIIETPKGKRFTIFIPNYSLFSMWNFQRKLLLHVVNLFKGTVIAGPCRHGAAAGIPLACPLVQGS